VQHYHDLTLAFSHCASFDSPSDCNERHVTASRPINGARCSWSYDKFTFTM